VPDLRWFAPNRYATLVVPELRRLGLEIQLEGMAPARLALAMGGAAAEPAWRYARAVGCPLAVYIWDLPPRATGQGRADPVWWAAGRFLRLPRPVGGYGRRRGYYSRLRYIVRRADAVLAPSAMACELLAERFGTAAARVPYCYDSDRFHPTSEERERPATLLTVSRLERHKNQAAVIRAAARIGGELRVRIIGRGPEAEALQRLGAELGVRAGVETSADDATVTRAYQTAWVAVCPSRFEGFGLTPIEAIACGTPVVASDIPPHREFVGSAARLVPPDDIEAMAAAIAEALAGPSADPALVADLTIPAAAARILSSLAPLLQ
jgi:glycosyltransferase involved in cell wall biosynthesis